MEKKDDIIISTIICFVFLLLFSQIIEEKIIKPRLYDGTINRLGRYSFTIDAYDYISDNYENYIIAIGSSRMREIYDGISLKENSSHEIDFFNLAYGMDLPIIRMIEVDNLIEIKPKLVIVEVGPSTFSEFSEDVWYYNRTIEFMSHMISMNPRLISPDWVSLLSEKEKEILPLNYFEAKNHFANYGIKSIETSLEYYLNGTDKPFSCSYPSGHVRCVPMEGKQQEDYDKYIRYPSQLPNILEGVKKNGTIINSNGNPYAMSLEKYYGEYLDARITNPYHNPEGVKNLNHLALDYMIDKFQKHDIDVLLVGFPYNPVLLDRLEDGKWDYVNESIQEYSSFSNVFIQDMTWDKSWTDDHFSDLAHASREGELYFTSRLYPIIDEIIKSNN